MSAHGAPPAAPSTTPRNSAVQLAPTASLTATLAVNTQAAVVGGTLVYTLTLVNNGDVAGSFAITDTLPDGLALIDAPRMQVNGQTLVTNGTLMGGAQQQFVITAQVRLYRPMIRHEATVRFGDQTHLVVAPVVRIASPSASLAYYLPLMIR